LDLDSENPDLALTQLKFARILDEIANVRAFETGAETVGDRSLEGLLREGAAVSPAADPIGELDPLVFSRPDLPTHTPVAMAAATATEPGRLIVWTAPHPADWTAFVRLPAPSHASDDSLVELFLPNAPDEASVRFCGLEADLSFDGKVPVARFVLGELRSRWLDSRVASVVLLIDGDELAGRLDEGDEGSG